ncbi:MAG: WD40 repeat domain-containing protein [Gemmataceae bacterium]
MHRSPSHVFAALLAVAATPPAADPEARRTPAFVLKDGDVKLEDVQISPDGKLVAARGSRDEQVRVWSLPASRLLYRLDQRPLQLGGPALSFTRDGKSLLVWSDRHSADLSTSAEQRLRWYDPRTGKEARKLTGAAVFGDTVAQSPDGKLMVTGGHGEDDEALYVREPQTGKPVFKFTPPQGVREAAFTPDGKHLYLANRADEIWSWDVATRERTQRRKQDPEVSGIDWLAFTPDGGRIGVGCRDSVSVLDRATGKRLRKTDFPTRPRAICFARGGRWVLQGYGPYVVASDAATGKRLVQSGPCGANADEIATTPDGKWLAVVAPRRAGILVFKLADW